MKYNIENIASVIKGKFLIRHENALIEHILLDSRKLIFPQTSLFFALKTQRRNGHDFIEELYNKGLRNFVIMQSEAIASLNLSGVNVIQVKDSLQALQTLAAHHRKQFSIPVIGITGSNGKTIVKEWVNQLLEDRYNIVRSPKSYNSQIGVPLSVWQMNESNNLAIFEAGISQAGEMESLQKIIQPSIGIFTNIGEAHNEGFLSKRQKVQEKLRLFAHVNTLIYCKDFPEINEAVAALRQQLNKGNNKPFEVFAWSAVTEAQLQVLTILKEDGKTTITANHQSQTSQIVIPFTDDASIENVIHCWCLLLHLKIPQTAISEKMLQLSPVAMRLEMKHGISNCTIINDSYSADLSSLKIALDFLAQQKQHEKKTVILSDILQSGRSEKDLYQEVAKTIAPYHVHRLIGIGEKIVKHQLVFQLLEKSKVFFYNTVDAFTKDIHRLHFQDETILLKGARIFEFEQIDRLFEQKIHQTILEIDLNAVAHNLKQYQQLLNPATKLMAMVKAFSYGSGSFEIASVLQFHKADYLAVAYADEGVDLRKAGITLPIMIMNPDDSSFDALIQYNLEPELYSIEFLQAFVQHLKKQGIQQFPVHLELETGMNRLGFSPAQMPQLLEALKSSSFKVQTVFSHLVASEDPQYDAFTEQQFRLFNEMCDALQNSLPYSFSRHIANSAAIVRHPHLQMDMVRLGIGLYGIKNTDDEALDLKEVSALKSTIAQLKKLKAGDTVSYGRNGKITRDSTIATVRIGYADGYPRSLSNGIGKMQVNGYLAPIVGNICMDMTMIDVTDVPNINEGDEVIVFGRDLPVTNVAQWAQTIPYEILTGISQRVKRVYFEE